MVPAVESVYVYCFSLASLRQASYLVYVQLYCAQWLGKDYIICGGTDQNMARIIDRGTLNVSAPAPAGTALLCSVVL